ncbi:TRAP transporter small permease [Ferviditalea candida]|uniref:TRAP transporter small permease n=1 Tax=Ferviditalea candida TaxID=3108399 RepID=A0ABU5ZL60_9BACL|nr:TRAP transporter small permease [Paenibacillaceae bacterium T2]
MKTLSRLLAKASSINDLLSGFLALMGGIIIVGLMLVIFGASISRYLFGQAVAAATELSAYSLLFVTFLGAPYLAGKNSHVRVDALPHILKGKAKAAIEIFAGSLSFLVSLLLAWYGFNSTYKAYVDHEVVINILSTPKYFLLAIIALGFLLMAISFLFNVIKHFNGSGTRQ